MNTEKPKEMICRKCGKLFPFNEEHFTKDSSRRFGLKPLCLECNKKSCLERRNRNLEIAREKDRLRYASDLTRKESAKNRAKVYYQENSEKVKQNVENRRKARKEAGLPRLISEEAQQNATEKNRIRCRENYHQDIDQSRIKERARVRTDEDRATRRRWRQNNPDKIKANLEKRKKLLQAATVEPITKSDTANLRIKQNGCCFYCAIEMTVKGKLKETIDHLSPISKGGLHSLSNIVLACLECNLAKKDQDIETFLKRTDRPRFTAATAKT